MTRLAGIAAIAMGALLLGQTDPFASILSGALGSPAMHVDWLLLAAFGFILGGGLLVQITWARRDE